MQTYKGYFIDGDAMPVHPYSPDWYVGGSVLVPGPGSSVVEVTRFHEPVLGVRAVGRGLVEPAVLGLGHPVGPEPHPVALLAPRGPHGRDHERGDGGDETADGAHHGYP